MEHIIYEIIGYIASFLVAVSLMMSSILRLRVINLIGGLCFTLYGLLIGAYPVAVVNFIIALINVYFLYEMFTAKEYFKILEVSPQSDYLRHFLKFYDAEIKKFLPNFQYTPDMAPVVFFILRDMVPAALIVAHQQDEKTLLLDLDFVIPGYRDFKVGKFIFSENPTVFTEKGFQKIISSPGNKEHTHYLKRIGFVPDSRNPEHYVKELSV